MIFLIRKSDQTKVRVQFIRSNNAQLYVQEIESPECIRYWIDPSQIMGIEPNKKIMLFVNVTGASFLPEKKKDAKPTRTSKA